MELLKYEEGGRGEREVKLNAPGDPKKSTFKKPSFITEAALQRQSYKKVYSSVAAYFQNTLL